MSGKVQIKIHDVMHDKGDYNSSDAEEYLEKHIIGVQVSNVRVAPGPKNSPLFVTLDRPSLRIKEAKRAARSAVKCFTAFVDGVDVDRTIRDGNIRVMSVQE